MRNENFHILCKHSNSDNLYSCCESLSVTSDSLQPQDYSPWDSPGQNTGVRSPSLLQGIFPTLGSKPGLPHCKWFLYQLSQRVNANIGSWDPVPNAAQGSSGGRGVGGGPTGQVAVCFFLAHAFMFSKLNLAELG